MADTNKITTLGGFVWSVAEVLRGDLKQSEYGRVVLPFVVLRRLDCVLAPTKADVIAAVETLPDGIDDATRDLMLCEAAGEGFTIYNTSPFTFESLAAQSAGQLHKNLLTYIAGFSPNVRDIFLEKFGFAEQLKRLNDAGILYQVFDRFRRIDLHPSNISNLEMGYLFEEMIRRFSEISNETAGEHFTPREVVRLIVELLLAHDTDALSKPGTVRRVYDPACGTGGMLTIGELAMRELNPKIRVELYGQELNPESFAICKSDMLMMGHDPEQIAFGNTLTSDAHGAKTFHYMLSNPPYGVDWKKYQEAITSEHKTLGDRGRFGAGLPRVSDGQLLFVQHMVSKMRDDETGSRIGIVMNGSPLFTGGAGSGESNIRRWLIERDLVEAIIGLPTDLFYNTGIQTYVWILTNRKTAERAGTIQLIDASGEQFWRGMRKSLGSKRREIANEARAEIVRIYNEALNGEAGYGDVSKVLPASAFGYREIRIERPLRLNFQASADRIARLADEKAYLKLSEDEREEIEVVLLGLGDRLHRNRDAFEKDLGKALKAEGVKLAAPIRKAILSALSERDEDADICMAAGKPEPDSALRDFELVPLDEDWRSYVAREVTPFVPDAWVDETYRDEQDARVGRVGYEINFNRFFYRYVPPRPLHEIDAELKALEAEIAGLLREVME
ncbi:MAG: class I SAM-dependent DNA methyltransferase [Amaricoccus sp.]|uniref:type I restriction-modification system subunit M n=1 Tax=Amaricoccus sp. TaxID=1872485 RepID=UPI0033149AEE